MSWPLSWSKTLGEKLDPKPHKRLDWLWIAMLPLLIILLAAASQSSGVVCGVSEWPGYTPNRWDIWRCFISGSLNSLTWLQGKNPTTGHNHREALAHDDGSWKLSRSLRPLTPLPCCAHKSVCFGIWIDSNYNYIYLLVCVSSVEQLQSIGCNGTGYICIHSPIPSSSHHSQFLEGASGQLQTGVCSQTPFQPLPIPSDFAHSTWSVVIKVGKTSRNNSEHVAFFPISIREKMWATKLAPTSCWYNNYWEQVFQPQ